MAIGKNKKLGKKKGQKRIIDPFTKKEWYKVRAPALFQQRDIGRTVVTKSAGNKSARDSLLGRCFTVSQGDLTKNEGNGDSGDAFRKFRLRVEEVSGKYCLTNFHGMDFSRDKLCALVRKWQTLIEAQVEVKTADGYLLRLFAIAFTTRMPNQNKKTSYAQTAQTRMIRKRMSEIIEREAANIGVTELVKKLANSEIGAHIQKATQGIYPLQNCFIRKVKVLRAPKTDVTRLMEAHGGAANAIPVDVGVPVERDDDEESGADEEAGDDEMTPTE